MSSCWLFWKRLSLASGIALSSIFCMNAVQAQITSDGTLPTPTDVTENGNVTEIRGGTVEGSNLFHSFQDFSVGTNGTADFLNADSISNIFSRVTGGNPSNIDGLIRTNNASLFFLNPAGIIFGAGASLELGGGSFYGTTADSLLFEDGEFIASNTDTTPILSINAPIGLGFRDDPADITLAGNENAVDLIDFAFLSVEDNQSINLIGGNLNLSDALLFAPGGRVELGGLAAAGTVDINEDGSLDFPDNLALGNVSLDNSIVFVVFSEDGEGGSININGNDIDLLGGSILRSGIDENSGFTEAQSGDINLNATGAINISEISRIQNRVGSGGTGNAGDINISGNSFSLSDGAFLESSTFGQGDSGLIQITTEGAVELAGDSEIFNNVEQGASGNSLGITIDAQSLNVTGGSQIQTLVRGSTDENPNFGQGNAGDININVRDTVSFSGFSENSEGTIFPSTARSFLGANATGSAGNINITAKSVSLSEQADIDSSTFGQGNAGNITIDTEDSVELSNSDISSVVGTEAEGNGGNINISGNSFSLRDSSFLESSTFGQGNSGQIQITTEGAVELAGDSEIFNNVERGAVGDSLGITIDAQSLNVTGGSQIQTLVRGSTDQNPEFGEGNAGDININVRDTVSFSGSSVDEAGNILFFSQASSELGTGATGSGGNINIQANSLSLSDGAFLESSTSGVGDSGQIQITTEGAVELAGDSEIFNNVERGASGDSLGITIDAQSLNVTGGSQIQTLVRASTDENPNFGQGNAGDINIIVEDTVSFSGFSENSEGTIFSSKAASSLGTDAIGNAGNINITASSLSLSEQANIDSSTSGQGNAGNIDITADTQIELINKGGIFSSVGAEAKGKGGKITINSNSLSASNSSIITTDTAGIAEDNGRADAGDIEINVSESLEFIGGSSINSNTFGEGDAGDIVINAEGASVSFRGIAINDDLLFLSGLFSTVSASEDPNSGQQFIGRGNGGQIEINADTLAIEDGAIISTSTFGEGNAGDIVLNINGAINLIGKTRDTFQGVERDFTGGIGSEVGNDFINDFVGQGNAGDITINGGSLSVNDGNQIASGTSGLGNAGDISIEVSDFVNFSNSSNIRSNVEVEGIGNGGDINLKARSLTLESGSQIGAAVFREVEDFELSGGRGIGGDITIETTDFVEISGVSSERFLSSNPNDPSTIRVTDVFSSGIFASVERGGAGLPGNITISTKDFRVADAGLVDAITANVDETFVSNDNNVIGNITITADTFEATGGGQIITTTRGINDAGNIKLNIADEINISGSDPTFQARLDEFGSDIVNNQGAESGIFANTASGSTGEGGSITIGSNTQPVEDVFLADEGRIAANSDGAGDGGNIEFFVSDRLQLSGDSIISARSSTSNGGNIIINADDGFLIAFPSPNNSQGNDIVADAQGGTGGNITIRTQGVLGLEEGRAANNNGSNDIDASGQTNGVVEIITPDVDAIQGAAELPTNPVEPDTSVAQTCSADKIAQGSSLTVNGKGGIPPLPIEPLSSDLVLAQNPQATQHESIKPISTSIGDIFPARGVIVYEDGTFDLVAYATENQQRQVVPQTSCGKRAAIHN